MRASCALRLHVMRRVLQHTVIPITAYSPQHGRGHVSMSLNACRTQQLCNDIAPPITAQYTHARRARRADVRLKPYPINST
eukprot:7628387-Pyramimonas_sp.AAC.1